MPPSIIVFWPKREKGREGGEGRKVEEKWKDESKCDKVLTSDEPV